MTDYTEMLQNACILYTTAAKRLAISEANYKDVDSQTKTRLSMAYNKWDSAKSIKDKEMFSLSDQDYIDWQMIVSTARKKYLADRADVSIQEKRWETARSVLSMERAKTKIL